MKYIVEHQLKYPIVDTHDNINKTHTIIPTYNGAEILAVKVINTYPTVWLLEDDQEPESKYEFLVLAIISSNDKPSKVEMPDGYTYVGIGMNSHIRYHILYKQI